MLRFFPLGIIGVLILIGFISKKYSIVSIEKRRNETTDYHNDFVELVNRYISTKGVDNEIYSRLMLRVNKMQRELGSDGIMAVMYDPLKGIRTTNYQMLINFLPEMNEYYDMWDSFGRPNTIIHQRFMNSANICRDMFIRHVGSLEELMEDEKKRWYNPFSCLVEGVKVILWIPFYILTSFGLFTGNVFSYWRTKPVTKISSALIAIIGLLSSVVTIAIGWEQFTKIINDIVF